MVSGSASDAYQNRTERQFWVNTQFVWGIALTFCWLKPPCNIPVRIRNRFHTVVPRTDASHAESTRHIPAFNLPPVFRRRWEVPACYTATNISSNSSSGRKTRANHNTHLTRLSSVSSSSYPSHPVAPGHRHHPGYSTRSQSRMVPPLLPWVSQLACRCRRLLSLLLLLRACASFGVGRRRRLRRR